MFKGAAVTRDGLVRRPDESRKLGKAGAEASLYESGARTGSVL